MCPSFLDSQELFSTLVYDRFDLEYRQALCLYRECWSTHFGFECVFILCDPTLLQGFALTDLRDLFVVHDALGWC